MNLLSHFFSGEQKNNPYYNFGLVFPDLLGVTNRKWKPLKFAESHEIKQLAWQMGCKKHLATDGIFHHLASFHANVVFIRKKFEENELIPDNIRLFFVAHILYELMLDRLVLINDPNCADNFYKDLNSIEDEEIEKLFKQNNIEGLPQFFNFFERFKEYQYVYNYIDDERLFFALNRILTRARQSNFVENDFPTFQKISFEVQMHLSTQFLSIFEAVN